MMLQFANPWLLAGLVAVGLPVAIHFLTRPRPRTIALPTFALLMQAGKGRQAFNRLRTLVVLALRTLAVFALVAMFARPFFTRATAAQGDAARRRVVAVVDRSMSMAAPPGSPALGGDEHGVSGATAIQVAASQAADLLRQMNNHDEAAVVWARAQPEAVLPALSRNRSALVQALAETPATLERADVEAAIAKAAQLLDGPGEIHVYSDFQATNWAGVDLAVAGDAKLVLHPVTAGAAANVGVTGLTLRPARPVAGEQVELLVQLFNSTDAPQQRTLSLDLHGVSGQTSVELPAYGQATAQLSFIAPQSGTYPGTVRMDNDALPGDNARYFTLDVRPQLRVLMIGDLDASRPGTPTFFASRALSSGGLQLQTRRSQQLDRGSLETSDAFVLVSPVRLTGEAAQIIARRVADEGVGLIWLIDGLDVATQLAALRDASDGRLAVPLELEQPVDAAEPVHPSPTEVRADYLAAFDAGGHSDFEQLAIRRYVANRYDAAAASQVPLAYPDGSAAMATARAGQGRLVLINMPATLAGGNFVASGLFPSLLHEMVRYVRQADARQPAHPGLPWRFDVQAQTAAGDASPYVVTTPAGHVLPARVVARGSRDELSIDPTNEVGHHRVALRGAGGSSAPGSSAPGSSAPQVVGFASVNVDPRETDTRVLREAGLNQLAKAARIDATIVQPAGQLKTLGDREPWWPVLAVLLAAALGGEMLVLSLWRKRGTAAGRWRGQETSGSPLPGTKLPGVK